MQAADRGGQTNRGSACSEETSGKTTRQAGAKTTRQAGAKTACKTAKEVIDAWQPGVSGWVMNISA